MATVTLAKLISDWELLNAALQPHLTDMPFLKDKATELEGLIADAKGMDTKQQDLRGSLQETVRQRQDLEKRGRVLQSRLAALLRGSLGFDNQTLLGFGVKPRRPRKKKAPAEAPQPEPQPQPQPQPSAQQ
ncbi:MAG TPA: hypothetical protein VGP73_17055 [Thermoanaerobaculia bacterium]